METSKWYIDYNVTLSVGPTDEASSDTTVFDYANPLTKRRAEFDVAIGGLNFTESADAAPFSEQTDVYELWMERPYVKYGSETYSSVVAICRSRVGTLFHLPPVNWL